LIANLPYVPTAEVDEATRDASIRDLAPRDLARLSIAAEPRLALDGGGDGLELIRRLIAEMPRLLRPGGAALLEFGDGQGDDVARIADGLGIGWRVAIRGDLSGRDRMAEIRRSG
jgi:release factor glutamine methyltransferase